MLRKVVGLGLAGASFYVTQDAMCDALIYARCKAMVEERARGHPRFLAAVGAASLDDCALGPWYDASTAVGLGGMAATVVLPCRGPKHGSDITVRVLRKGGLRWPLLFTLAGGEWEPVMMDAKIGMGAGGTLNSISLLEAEEPALGRRRRRRRRRGREATAGTAAAGRRWRAGARAERQQRRGRAATGDRAGSGGAPQRSVAPPVAVEISHRIEAPLQVHHFL